MQPEDGDIAHGSKAVGLFRRLTGPNGLVVGSAVLWVVISTIYAFSAPLGGGPDEAEHVEYVEIMATDHRLPVLPGYFGAARKSVETEQAQHPPLYYGLLAPLRAALGDIGTPHARLVALRLLSLLLSLLALPIMLALAWALWPKEPWKAAVSVGLFALLPQTAFMTAFVTNSSLSMVLQACVALLCWRMLSAAECRPRDWLLVGLALGAAFLTKVTSAWMVGLVMVCAVAASRRPSESLRRRATCWLALIASCVVIVGPWLARNKSLYGSSLPERVTTRRLHQAGFVGMIAYPEDTAWAALFMAREIVPTYTTPYWLIRPGFSPHVSMPLLIGLSLPALGALGLGVVRRLRHLKGRAWPRRDTYLAGIATSLALSLLVVLYMAVRDMHVMVCLGRYVWEMSVPLSLLLAQGLFSVRSPRLRTALIAGTLAWLTVASVWVCQYCLSFFAGDIAGHVPTQ